LPAAACRGLGFRGRSPITIADLGEFGLIAEIRSLLPAAPGLIVGIGDDAAVVRAPDRRVVATTDLLVEGRHFRREWSSAFDIGCKAAAQNLADVAAMGASATALLVGLAAPGDLAVSWARDLVRGLGDEAKRAGAAVVGGDVSSAGSVVLAVTALGDLGGRDPVTRAGARPGDQVAVAGQLGRSAAGLALFEAGLGQSAERAGRVHEAGGLTDLAKLIASHQRPRPPYGAGPQAASLGATSMIDISDGLVADLGHVADASGVLIDVQTARLPDDPGVRLAGQLLGADPLTWVLTGGEDHALAATFPQGASLPGRWRVIGSVSDGAGVTVDSAPAGAVGGWRHFS
jgi:thiamine-monophosphate kinase